MSRDPKPNIGDLFKVWLSEIATDSDAYRLGFDSSKLREIDAKADENLISRLRDATRPRNSEENTEE